MINHSNPSTNNGCANFDAIIVDVKCDMPSEHITANIHLSPEQFDVSRYSPKVLRPDMPVFSLGSLVALVSFGECVHAGMVTEVLEDGEMPSFVIDTWPLTERVALSKRELEQSARTPSRAMRYAFEDRVGDQNIGGNVTKLRQIDADHLRTQIGLVVPSMIQEIFWSEAERLLIEANNAAQQCYVDRATALIDNR